MSNFHYRVKSHEGDGIEMEIWHDYAGFTLHYPVLDFYEPKVTSMCFMKLNFEQLAAVLFVYDAVEYDKFIKFVKQQ